MSLKNDSRYKVNDTIVRQIRQLRATGMSYAKIAESIGGITWSTAYYWASDKARETARKKNAQRRHTPAENAKRIPKDMERRKQRWEEDPNTKLAHEIRAALSDKRIERKTVRGIPIQEAKRMLESGELNASNLKIK
jgi:hypothetical protein|tara:strand:- start:4061 stop:4471 length:411 start_codon:yes stop_codon:yes gene_type:complete